MLSFIEKKYQKLRHSRLVKSLLNWSKRTSLPGFNRVPIYYVAKFFINEIQKESIAMRSNSIAFSFFLALFPFIIFLIALVSFIRFRSTQEYLNTLHKSVEPFLPGSVDSFLFHDVINGIFEVHRGDLLSIGVILSLYFASNGVLNLMMGFEKQYESYKGRNILRKRLLALGLTLGLGLLTMLALSLLLFSENLIHNLLELAHLSKLNTSAIFLARWIIVLMLFYGIIALLYRYGPNLKIKSSLFSPGTNIATIGIILTSVGFGYYLNRFDNFNAIYGSLGAIIITLLWIKINATIILIGYELNASIAVNKHLLEMEEATQS